MATSSILGGTRPDPEISGKNLEALGPSDNSDSGSDALGAYGDGELNSDSDSVGTGERAAVGTGMERVDADILPDRLESATGDGEGGGEDEPDDAGLVPDDGDGNGNIGGDGSNGDSSEGSKSSDNDRQPGRGKA